MDSESATMAESEENVSNNKKGIDLKVAEVLKLIRNNEEDKKGKVPEDSKRRSAEIIKLVEDIQKQYQKLYAEYKSGKKCQGRKEKDTSSSSSYSSTSDTDYYSSDDKHINETTIASNIKGKASFKDVLTMDKRLPNEHKQDTSLATIRYELESKALECKKLESIQNQLKKKVSDLEIQLKGKGDEVFNARKRLKDNETRMTHEMKRLQNELEAMRRQKEEHMRARENEENVLRNEINDVSCQKRELAKRLQNQCEEVRTLQEEIDALKDELKRMSLCVDEHENDNLSLARMNHELKLDKEKEVEMLEQDNKMLQSIGENLKLQIRELEDAVESKITSREEILKSQVDILLLQRSDLEESINKYKTNEDILRSKMQEMERSLLASIDKMERIQRKRDEESRQMSALRTQLECLHQQLESLVAEKNKLEAEKEEMKQHFERKQKEAENEIHNLNQKMMDKLRVSKEKEKGFNKPEDLKQMKSLSIDISKQRLSDSPRFLGVDSPKLSQRSLERKIEELADKFQMNLENHVRLLYQRILVAEQMHAETRDHYKKSKEIFYEEKSKDNGKLIACELEIADLKSLLESTKEKQKKEEAKGDFTGRVENLFNGIPLERDRMETKDEEATSTKQEIEALSAPKESNELRDMEEPNKIEIRVEYLEHLLRDREDVLLSLVEEKREAIRQLCIIIDYHRKRYEDMKMAFFKFARTTTH